MLALIGCSELFVVCKLRVCIVVIGNELFLVGS